MNILIIIVAMVACLISLVFSTRLQTAVFQTLQLAGIISQGIWNRVAPTVYGMFVTILQTAWKVARFALIVLLILWAVNLVVFWGIGSAVHAPWSGLFLGIFIPLFLICFAFRKFPGIGNIAEIPMVVSLIVMIVFAPFFVIGVFSPDIKGSADRWAYNQKKSVAYSFDKSSLKSEAEFGVIGKTKMVTAMYDDSFNAIRDRDGKEYLKLRQGARVKAADTKGKDGMTQVILENPNGDFTKGNVVWVSSDKLDWNM